MKIPVAIALTASLLGNPSVQVPQTPQRVVWKAQPRQALLIGCPAEDVLFGGARGGGKTDGMLGDWIQHQAEYGENAHGVFFRRTYKQLENVMKRSNKLFKALGATYNKGEKTWYFPNGATMKFRHLMSELDAENYQGHAYTWVCFEELTNWPDPGPVDRIRAAMRSGDAVVPCYFRATANPGGVGHNWVKARYIDPAAPMVPHWSVDDEETGFKVLRVFIPSRLEDNLALQKNDPNYRQRVAAAANGNMALFKAWMEGNWDIVAGGMLDDVFDRNIHVIPSFNIPASWSVTRSYDHGESKPFSVGWWAISDGTTAPNGVTYSRGTKFRVAEWYGCKPSKPNKGIGLTSVDIARGIKERERRIAVLSGHKVIPGPADSAIFAAQDGVSIADKMKAEGVEWVPADKRPGSRKIGWSALRELLANAKKSFMEDPGLFIFDTCTDWIRTVPVLSRDTRDPDDVDTKTEDHAGDETRYLIMAPPPARSFQHTYQTR